METIKALTLEDTHFFFEIEGQTIDIDSIRVILLWNGIDQNMSLMEKYESLRIALSQLLNREIDLANTYLMFEKSCSLIASLKKTFLRGQS